VSTPIADSKNPQQVKGILIVGRLLTPEVVQFLEHLTYTNMKIWPLEGATLSNKHLNIIERIQKTGANYLIVRDHNTLHGYMSLPDLSGKPNLLISIFKNRNLKSFVNIVLLKNIAIFIAMQILFLILLFYLIRHFLVVPANQLIDEIQLTDKKWTPPSLAVNPDSDMGQLNIAITHFMARQHNQLVHDTALAYREGMSQARQDLYQEFEETLLPLFQGLDWLEKKLSNLPINDIEWIVAEGKTGQITPSQWPKYTERLQTINEELRRQQKEMRQHIYEIHTKTLRNAAVLRTISRSLDPTRQLTPIGVQYKGKLSTTR
ncbi:MAG TPA: hypothetical protein PLD88_06430, partial [Candidatus Berkiella sp.]|nr:hypothetical protein [Candidatus Berkiella sp.]